jgi:uncharacterized alkaline shock family protein YloU
VPAQQRTDADRVVGIACAVPGVTGMHGGMFGEVATYLPGRRIHGVRLDDTHIDVHVVLSDDAAVRETATAVRQAVAAAFSGFAVDVTVEDISFGPSPRSLSEDLETGGPQ